MIVKIKDQGDLWQLWHADHITYRYKPIEMGRWSEEVREKSLKGCRVIKSENGEKEKMLQITIWSKQAGTQCIYFNTVAFICTDEGRTAEVLRASDGPEVVATKEGKRKTLEFEQLVESFDVVVPEKKS